MEIRGTLHQEFANETTARDPIQMGAVILEQTGNRLIGRFIDTLPASAQKHLYESRGNPGIMLSQRVVRSEEVLDANGTPLPEGGHALIVSMQHVGSDGKFNFETASHYLMAHITPGDCCSNITNIRVHHTGFKTDGSPYGGGSSIHAFETCPPSHAINLKRHVLVS